MSHILVDYLNWASQHCGVFETMGEAALMTVEKCDCQSLRKRVDALERQHRKSKQVGVVILIAVACAVFMAQAAPKRTVEAKEFILRDEADKIRARLWASADGPSLSLYDPDGTERATLADGPVGPLLAFKGTDGKNRLKMGVQHGDDSGIDLFDKNGKMRAELWVQQSGSSGLALVSAQSQGMVQLSLEKAEWGNLTFFDAHGKGRAQLQLLNGNPELIFADANEAVVWSAPPSVTTTVGKPRVAIESWAVTQMFKPQKNAQPFDEMPVFVQKCPQVAAALEKTEGDYFLRLEHHYIYQGTDFYQYSLLKWRGHCIGLKHAALCSR
jgi:hypothetical protein